MNRNTQPSRVVNFISLLTIQGRLKRPGPPTANEALEAPVRPKRSDPKGLAPY
jgi:hypothetical protein